MELKEKLQALRKQKGLAQEELAQRLYVSRTAISKWESGRGYPSIDSLKALAGFFSVSVDDLLSDDRTLINSPIKPQKPARFRDLSFGILDCCALLLLFLPLFGQKADGILRTVSLLSLTEISAYLKIGYLFFSLAMVLSGVLILSLKNFRFAFWMQHRYTLSLLCNAAAAFLFIISRQPYPAAILFVFLGVKGFWLFKKP